MTDKCLHCEKGDYVRKVDPDSEPYVLSNFGLNQVGEAEWLIEVCDLCGHVKFFRLDLAAKTKA
jgi:hypothetical protein